MQLLVLRKTLAPFLRDGGLVLLSMDLSHYKSPAEAAREDVRTLPVLARMDASSLRDLDIDTPRGAALFLSLVRDLGSLRGAVLDHSDSGAIRDRPDEPCTSYATMLFTK